MIYKISSWAEDYHTEIDLYAKETITPDAADTMQDEGLRNPPYCR
jgi:hypothetical protein